MLTIYLKPMEPFINIFQLMIFETEKNVYESKLKSNFEQYESS